MINMKKKKGIGCISAIFIIVVITLTIWYIYRHNPEEFQARINLGAEEFQKYLNIVSKTDDSAIQQDNIELPEVEELTEAQKYYYYQQLSETGKKIYVTIENNIENFKNGQESIPLPASVNEIAKTKGKEYVTKEFQSAWDAFITNRSEYFYLDSSKVCLMTKMTTKGSNVSYEFSIGKGENSNYFAEGFNSKEDVEKAIEQVEQARDKILKGATGNNYEKMLEAMKEVIMQMVI